jgi:hypothetical protein
MAAGLGFKDFTTGEVLTAADVDGYLMQGIWVFASTAARNAAVTSPQEGNFAFTKDTNSLWYYDGAAWVASGATGDIEGVTAGTGISGGGTSGTVTITNDMATTITAAGDIVVGTGSGTYDNLPIGTTAQVLTADTTVSPYKVKWATPASGSTFVGCVVKNTSAQTLTNNTNTAIAWTAEDIDTDGFHDNTTNNSRITIPTGKGGKYLISAKLAYAGNATGERAVQIYKNGSLVLQMNVKNGLTGTFFTPTNTGVFTAVATDYFEIYGYQNSGGNLNTEPGGSGETMQFSATYLGA